ncbi:MAG: hypothetical protein AAGF04_02890 [Chlamydiota bacterium]
MNVFSHINLGVVADPVREPRLHRNFAYDITQEQNARPLQPLRDRVFQASLALLPCFIPSISRHVSVGANTLRLFSATNECSLSFEKITNLSLAVIAFTGSIFSESTPALAGITVLHDTILDVGIAFTAGEFKEKIFSSLRILNNITYLSLIMYGTLEMQIVSLATQIIFNIASAVRESLDGRGIEAATNLIITGVRVKQAQGYFRLWQRRQEIAKALKNIYVGELAEKWEFCSDHIPVFMRLKDEEGEEFNVVTCNVLNDAYLGWLIDKDSQGINGSAITQYNYKKEGEKLTERNHLMIDTMKKIMNNPKSGMIMLQECSTPFLKALQKDLPGNWKLTTIDKPLVDREAILYNPEYVSLKGTVLPVDPYPSAPGRSLMHAIFEKRGGDKKRIHVVNAHVPGDPNLPCRDEFADYVKKLPKDDIRLAGGDLNFERLDMIHAFEKAGLFEERYPEQVFYSPAYHTNIHPRSDSADTFGPGAYHSKAIDHMFTSSLFEPLNPADVIKDRRIENTIEVLRTPASLKK